MCMTIPGKILKVEGEWAVADFLGRERKVSLRFLKAGPGDYILSAGGIAAEKIPPEKAKKMLDILKVASDGDKG